MSQFKALQKAYGRAMLKLRGRKNGTRCWRRRMRHGPSYPARSSGRRFYGSDGQALSLVRGSSPYRVLPQGLAGSEEGYWVSSTDRSAPVGRHDAERTLGNSSLPHLSGPRLLGQPLALIIDCHTRGLLGRQSLEKLPSDNGDTGARAVIDLEVRDARAGTYNVPPGIEQRTGLHLSSLYAPHAQL
jgi:hypothetical protein